MWSYTLLPKILNMSMTGSLVILAVILARLLLRRIPKIFSYVLWGVVLFRLLCPVSILSDFSVLNLVDVPVSSTGSVEYISPNIVHTEKPTVALPLPDVSEAINNNLPSGEEQLAADPLETPVAIATNIWIIGIAVMLLYSLASLVRLRRKLVGAVLLRENIYLADHIEFAFVLGLFFPKIYLPSNLNENEQDYILQHEQCHIRRGDPIVKILAFAALCIHWFNPLVWIAFLLAGNDMEMSCDEAVMRKMDRDIRADYAASLLHQSVKKRSILATPLAFGEGDVKGRIKNVLNYKKPLLWVTLLAVAAIVVLSVCLVSNPSQRLAVTTIEDTSELTATEAAWYGENSQTMGATVLQTETGYLFLYRGQSDLYGYYTATAKLKGSTLQIDVKSNDAVSEQYISSTLLARVVVDAGKVDGVSMNFDGENLTLEVVKDFELTPEKMLVIQDVITLSQEGEALTWTNFDDYTYTETGSGLYIRIYAIDEQFSLSIGGGSTNEKPMYVRLVSNTNQDDYIDIRTEDVEAFIAEHTVTIDPLDEAVSAAILTHYVSQKPPYAGDADFACESHSVLLKSSAGRFGGSRDTAIVYAMVLYQEYRFSDNGIEEVSGSHVPVALTFTMTDSGGYELAEYWEPRDGSYYTTDIRERFPKEIAEDALDTQKYILVQKQSCYAQAVERGQIDTDGVIARLLNTVASSPASSSDPADYIESNPIEYRELTYYGDYTLRYIISEFMKGNQTDLRGYIMAIVCEELLQSKGETPLDAEDASNGQEWFDTVLAQGSSMMKPYL